MDFRQFYARGRGHPARREPVPRRPGVLTAWGGPFPYPPFPALLAAPLTALSDPGRRAPRHGTPRPRRTRDPVRPRCPRLALLRARLAVATGDLGDPDGAMSRSGSRWLLRSPGASAMACSLRRRASASRWRRSSSSGRVVVWLAATRRLASARSRFVDRRGDAPRLVGRHRIRRPRRRTPSSFEGSSTPSARTPTPRTSSASTSACRRQSRAPSGSRSAQGCSSASSLLARRGDDRSAFILAIAASLALTPIVWLHYFALLLVPVAVSRPRLGVVWFVPLAMVVTPGSGHPTPFETAWTLGVAAVTVGLALRESHALVRSW